MTKDEEKTIPKKVKITDVTDEDMRKNAAAKRANLNAQDGQGEKLIQTTKDNSDIKIKSEEIENFDKISDAKDLDDDLPALGLAPIVTEASSDSDEDDLEAQEEEEENEAEDEDEQETRLKRFNDVRKVLNEKIIEKENSKNRLSSQLSNPLQSIPVPAERNLRKHPSIIEENSNSIQEDDDELTPPFELRETEHESQSNTQHSDDKSNSSRNSDTKSDTQSLSNIQQQTSEILNSSQDRSSATSEKITEMFKDCSIDESVNEESTASSQPEKAGIKTSLFNKMNESISGEDEFCDSIEI